MVSKRTLASTAVKSLVTTGVSAFAFLAQQSHAALVPGEGGSSYRCCSIRGQNITVMNVLCSVLSVCLFVPSRAVGCEKNV